jgi:threonylcarbamoyladenosine tRNA methylthiotransferase MtaB
VKYSVVTFGCRVNQADSLEIEGALLARGATCVPAASADVVVVNSCSVTAAADQGARQTIRKIARENPAARIVVTGCYATRAPGELAALPGVVRVVPNPGKDRLADLVAAFPLSTAERYAGQDGPCGAALVPGVAGRTAFTLRVQTGCDEACSYCIIPTTRGRGQSKPLAWVHHAVDLAVRAGYREIALCGVHLGSYGRDLPERSSLEELVRMLAAQPGDLLFRISSLEPMDCTAEVVAAVAGSPRLAPHFHLPLQHGDDAMLRAMRRPYVAQYYERLVTGIAAAIPGVAIGTDVIAGFPGETEEQAERLAVLLERLPLSHVHVFPYSDRPGSEASGMPGKIDGPTMRARAARLRTIGERLSARFKASQLGQVRRALVVDDGTSAVTDNYLKLALDRPRTRNEWVDVLVEGPHQGRVVSRQSSIVGRQSLVESALTTDDRRRTTDYPR